MESQVISKQRVSDHGEVFTGRREVDAMLDLVKTVTLVRHVDRITAPAMLVITR